MPDNFRKDPVDERYRQYDPLVHALTVIQEQHRLIHDGMMFHATGQAADVATPAGTYEILLDIPAGVYPHIQKVLWHIQGAPAELKVFEGTTTSASGGAVTEHNTNRNSANAAGMIVTTEPTVTGDGTLIHERYIPTSGKDVGQVAGTLFEEWIFKPSTKYLIRLTNNSGAVCDLSWEIQWYEVGYEV